MVDEDSRDNDLIDRKERVSESSDLSRSSSGKRSQEIWLRSDAPPPQEGIPSLGQENDFAEEESPSNISRSVTADGSSILTNQASPGAFSSTKHLSRAEILVSDSSSEDEEPSIVRLRPTAFSDYIGQEVVKNNLYIACMAAKQRGEPVDHVLLHGPPGLGKTSLASIMAKELGVGFKVTSGPVIEKPGDLAAILTSLGPKDVLFIDEIHRLPRVVEEVLYPAMEDFHIDIVIGQGASAKSVRIPLKPFTLVGATTRTGLLTSPLRDRFGLVMRLAFYSVDELVKIIVRSAGLLGVQIDEEAARELGARCRGTPRIANRLLKRVRDVAQQRALLATSSEISGVGPAIDSLSTRADIIHNGRLTNGDQISIDRYITCHALSLLDIDPNGLDAMDREILQVIIDKFNGGPVGLDTIAAALGEDRGTVEDVYEPYLLQEGFIARTKRGREATSRAYEQLGLAKKISDQIKLLSTFFIIVSTLTFTFLSAPQSSFAQEKPTLKVAIKGDGLRVAVDGRNEALETCAESSLDLKVKYAAAICDKKRFWFDDCKNQRVYLRTLRFDPLRGEYKVISDTIEDRLVPEERSYQELENAWAATFELEHLPLKFLARGEVSVFDTDRPYIEVRVKASCTQGGSKRLDNLATNLATNLANNFATNLVFGLSDIKAFDSGMVRLDIPTELLQQVRSRIK